MIGATGTQDHPSKELDDIMGDFYQKHPEAAPTGLTDFTDLSNAVRFANRHRNKIRYCHKFGKWLLWTGKSWLIDHSGAVYRLAQEYLLSMLDSVRSISDEKARAAFLHEMAKLQNEKKLLSMLNLARHMQGIPIAPEDLDRDLLLFNADDFTVDFRTFDFLKHDPGHFITKISPFAIDGKVECPKWKEHLSMIFASNQELISFLQRAVGSCLVGDNRNRKLFLLWGSGANGKSLTLETIHMVLGDYGMKTPAETLLVKRFEGIPNDLARLSGSRFVYTSEVSDGKRLAESLVKEISGDKYLTARFMRGEWFEFPITFKIFLATNHLLTIRGTDPAIWDRIMLVPFNVRIPEEQRRAREELLEEFRAEASGILKWLMWGCHEWLIDGLNPPAEVLAANQTYRDEMDYLKTFFGDCCEISETAWVRSAEIYAAYEKWCKDNGEDPVKKITFGRRLREKGFRDFRRPGGVRAWRGITLQEGSQGSL